MKALRCTVVTVLAIVALAISAGPASAVTRGVVLSAPNKVVASNALCSTGLCANVNGTVTNNDGHVYDCQVVLSDLNFVVFDQSIAPGQSFAWNVTTPATSTLTFTLICDGVHVPGQTSHVKVLQP
jgi:hypothetical protein